MPYTFARSPAQIDKSKNTPGVDTSDIITKRRIQAIGSFVSTNGVLGSTKKTMTAAKGGNHILASTLNRVHLGGTRTVATITSVIPLTSLSNSGGTDIFITSYTSSGTVNWVARIAGLSSEFSYKMCTDSNGNINIIGIFDSPTLSFYNKNGDSFGRTLTYTSGSTGSDIFIAQYSSTGSVNWVAQIGGSNVDLGRSICTDSNGDIIVIGLFYTGTTLTFYDKNGVSFERALTNVGTNSDIFIAKYSSTGSVNWVAQIGGDGSFVPADVSTDSSRNINILSAFSGATATFYDKTGVSFERTLTSTGSNDIFIAQYTSAGFPSWVAKIGGTGSDTGYGISADSNGNIIVSGSFASQTLTFYDKTGVSFGRTLTYTSGSTGSDIFIAQYTSAGFPSWVAKIGGTGADTGYGISADSNGNINIVGSFASQTLTFYDKNGDSFGRTLTYTSESTGNDIFIAKYTSAGFPSWVAKIGGTGSDVQQGLCTDSNGNIIVSGYFASQTLTFYDKNGDSFERTLTYTSESTGNDIFIAKYTSAGFPSWVAKIGGTGSDVQQGLCTDSNGNIIVSGYFASQTLTFYDKNGNLP